MLRCHLPINLLNSIGAGEASDILNTRTKGQKPKLPEKPRFIEVSSNSVSLHFKAWKDGGCPMSHFVVESKKRYLVFRHRSHYFVELY